MSYVSGDVSLTRPVYLNQKDLAGRQLI